ELIDTGVFDGDRYFDVFVEYAKGAPEDILVRVSVVNRGPEPATLHLLPTLWIRRTWSSPGAPRPSLHALPNGRDAAVVTASHPELGDRWLCCEGSVPLLFTENETNTERLFGQTNQSRYVKDGINDCVVLGKADAVNPTLEGTKAAAHYVLNVGAG